MTVAEKIEMYKGKKAFIKDVSKVFEAGHKGSSVASVDYEVYIKDIELPMKDSLELLWCR